MQKSNEIELDITEIHKITLETLKEIIQICDKLEINYFVTFGSLIGAIRHAGFIPWDDDFDIMMLRPEYDKFVDYCLSNEKDLKPYKLLCRQNTKNYPYNIVRFNDMRYRAEYGNLMPYESGAFIDIYPLDGAGKRGDIDASKFEKKRTTLMKMVDLSINDHYEKSEKSGSFNSLKKYFARLIARLFGREHWMNKMENYKNLYPFDSSDYISEMVWDAQFVLFKKEWFSDYKIVKFEDTDVKIPVGWHEFLTAYYGDYMKLPPENERVANHDYKLFKR